MSAVRAERDDDQYRWLEDLDSDGATAWARQRSAESLAALGSPRFEELRTQLQAVLDADERIPLTEWHGGQLYNLWRDAHHPRGLWRRTTLAEFRRPEPTWEVVLDVDALAAAEGESWVWQDAEFLRPAGRRCLIKLSRGGADASVVREFDLVDTAFVPVGFVLAEAKTDVSWIDQDTIFIGTDEGPGSLTSSGYPRVTKRWRRGTPLSAATVVYQAEPSDVAAFTSHDPTPGFERDVVVRRIAFYQTRTYLRAAGGELIAIDVPDDAETDLHGPWLVVRPRSPWVVSTQTQTAVTGTAPSAAGPSTATCYPAGSLLVTRLDAYLAGDRRLTVLFEPDGHTSLSYHAWTRGHLILVLLHDVRSRLELRSPIGDGRVWQTTALVGSDTLDSTDVVDTNADHTEEYLLLSSGFLQPPTLRYGTAGGPATAADGLRGGGAAGGGATGSGATGGGATGSGATGSGATGSGATGPEIVRRTPHLFDVDGLSVRQLFASSADGTQIPYFVVGRADASAGPTLLSGYGGFEISRTPTYHGLVGRGWLARGGTYVVANIRGGGEYGPDWHRAALGEHRHRAYDDFAAVASDLVAQGITTPDRLGVEGASNGGLLTGVMLTRHPELFGAVVSQVPLLDMRRYHRLLAGASWMAEYGDPDVPADWAFLRTFSPYHNVHKGRSYPPALFVTSTRDDRVHPAHARKMVALMRSQGHDVTYYENMEGGHGAAADNAQLALKWALVLEFLWQRLAEPAP